MSSKKHRQHSPALKINIVRRHLVDNVPVSTLCEEYKVRPSLFYKWQKEVFEQAIKGYSAQQLPAQMSKDRAIIKRLEARLVQKNEVLAELMQEYVSLKKVFGEI